MSLGLAADVCLGQFAISGHVRLSPEFESAQRFPCCCVVGFVSQAGPDAQSLGVRTWETQPGWYRVSGPSGCYTLCFAGPGHFIRPVVLTNQRYEDGLDLDRDVDVPYDYAVMWERSWDERAATDYFQTFVARSTSITHAGFKFAHDGVDGEGRGSQTLLASVHRVTDDEPEKWPQIGSTVPIPDVNAGGALSIVYGAAWNSGEVPVEPGETYAVHLRAEKEGNGFQPFWQKDVYPGGDCYRIGPDGRGFTGHDMWMYIAGDGDGLLLPLNKRVQHEFHELTRFGRKWSQTYVAKGRSVASVIMYAAVATSQPWLHRQRAVVRVRRGGPEGPVVGTEKIAIGIKTATAESGVMGATFAPGEIEVEPGERYAIEFEAYAEHKGFNPWMKNPRDPYDGGAAWFNATERMDYDLDMIVIEYEHPADDWSDAVADGNLVRNGDMETGELDPDDHDAGGPEGWCKFAIDPGTAHWYVTDDAGGSGSRYARVIGGSISGRTVDGGYVQRVAGLDRRETYRLSARVRSSWLPDDRHWVYVGYDPTGQVGDPSADTIVWAAWPRAHGVFMRYASTPIRPETDAVSIWLRAKTTFTNEEPFTVDFDDVALQRVLTSPPRKPGP